MANLNKSTVKADTAREECLCVTSCSTTCSRSGSWHTHAEEPCPVHPHTLVDGPGIA